MNTFRAAAVLALLGYAVPAWSGPSVYRTAPDDPRAITVRATGDGVADDGAAIQQALDAASDRGFQEGVKNMVLFAGRGVEPPPPAFARKPPFPPPGSVPFNDSIADANPGTFYPAMGNIDIQIGAGNEGAAAIRFHAAQHAYLQHMDFDLGTAFGGVYMVGNYGADLHFKGGRYGIVTEKPSPAWSFTLVDSTFDGQRDAGIREHEAGLTMLNVTFRNTPVKDQYDPRTDHFTTLAEMFARDMAVPTPATTSQPTAASPCRRSARSSRGPAGAGRTRCRPTVSSPQSQGPACS